METVIVPKVGHEARSRANFVYLPHPVPKQEQRNKNIHGFIAVWRER